MDSFRIARSTKTLTQGSEVLIMFYQPDIRFRHLRTAYLKENIATVKQTKKTAE